MISSITSVRNLFIARKGITMSQSHLFRPVGDYITCRRVKTPQNGVLGKALTCVCEECAVPPSSHKYICITPHSLPEILVRKRTELSNVRTHLSSWRRSQRPTRCSIGTITVNKYPSFVKSCVCLHFSTYSYLLSSVKMWHKARSMRHPMRIEFINNGLQI